MATTQADIDRLQRALNSGVRSATYDGRTVTYKDDDDMRRRLQEMKDELAGGGGNAFQRLAARRTVIAPNRDLGPSPAGDTRYDWHK